MPERFCWYFRRKVPGEPNRDPIQGEFFASDAISDPGIALVRESIQNSLDAHLPQEKSVMVRIFLSSEEHAVKSDEIKEFFEGASEHFHAPKNGLRLEDIPASDCGCQFLAIEDFGTVGLEGDPTQPFRPETEEKNHFYYFFRAEGQSDKDESSRGSWGIGKHVFLRSSRISTMFGLTVRATDKQKMLMGKTVLKSPWIVASVNPNHLIPGSGSCAPAGSRPKARLIRR